MAKELAIVLFSGSLNSLVACALAAQKYRPVMIFAQTEPPGSRPEAAFDQAVHHFKPYRSHKLPLQHLQSLTSHEDRGIDADPRSPQGVVINLVRLLPIVAHGLRYAAHYNASSVYLGTRIGMESDQLTRVAEYAQVWGELVQLTCDRPSLDIQMPLLELDAWQVVDLGVQIEAPLAMSWSCQSMIGEPCGACRTCREREQAFIRAGRPDPLRPFTRTS